MARSQLVAPPVGVHVVLDVFGHVVVRVRHVDAGVGGCGGRGGRVRRARALEGGGGWVVLPGYVTPLS